MPFNLLLFPIVGGYYLLVRSRWLRYLHQRIDRQKLIFNSIIAGIGLLILAIVIKEAWLFVSPVTANICRETIPLSPSKMPYAGTTLLSFFLGVFIAELSNFEQLISTKRCIRFAIKEIGNELELLLDSSVAEEELVQITLKNDKVYVGWVKTLPIPQKSNYVKISPAFSGFRHRDSKKIEFNTQYVEVYKTYVDRLEATDIKSITSLVISMEEVLSANKFDIDMYERFLKIDQGQTKVNLPVDVR